MGRGRPGAGVAYKTAASWAGQDTDIAQTLAHMDEELAALGVHVTASLPERVGDLLRSRAWAAEQDPFMDGAFTREMAQAHAPAERDRLNTVLVSAWLAGQEMQQGASVGEADKLARDVTREAGDADGHRLESDQDRGRAQEGALEQDWEESAAHHEWDTAERREELAASLRGKADQAAVDARVLADISQGTHPGEAVKSVAPTAPRPARDQAVKLGPQLTKGTR